MWVYKPKVFCHDIFSYKVKVVCFLIKAINWPYKQKIGFQADRVESDVYHNGKE